MRRHAIRFHETEWNEIHANPNDTKFIPVGFEMETFDSDNGYSDQEETVECEPLVYYDNEYEGPTATSTTQQKPKKPRKPAQKTIKLGGRAIVYQLFEKEGEKARCKICSKMFNTSRGNTTTIRRHAQAKHPAEWAEIQGAVGIENFGGDFNEHEAYDIAQAPLIDFKVKEEILDYSYFGDDMLSDHDDYAGDGSGDKRGPATVYKLFEKEGTKARCKICSKVLSILGGTTTTLRRHCASFHPEEWAEAQGGKGYRKPFQRMKKIPKDLLFQVFDREDANQVQCNICGGIHNLTIRKRVDTLH